MHLKTFISIINLKVESFLSYTYVSYMHHMYMHHASEYLVLCLSRFEIVVISSMRIQTVKDDEPKIYILFFDLPLRVTVTCRKRANSVVSAWFFTSSQPNLKNRDTKALKPLQDFVSHRKFFFYYFVSRYLRTRIGTNATNNIADKKLWRPRDLSRRHRVWLLRT